MQLCGIVIHCADDDGANAGNNFAQIFAARIVEILHFAGVAAREPFRKMAKLFEFGGGRNAAKIESDGAGAFAKMRGGGEIEHTAMMQYFLRRSTAGRIFTAQSENSLCALALGALALIQSRAWEIGVKFREEYGERARARIPRRN